jgi:hypothetical protein
MARWLDHPGEDQGDIRNDTTSLPCCGRKFVVPELR